MSKDVDENLSSSENSHDDYRVPMVKFNNLDDYDFLNKNVVGHMYAEHKQQRQMLVERKNKFQHIICTIIRDNNNEKYQSFSRGNALTIFERCTDYWTGSKIEPI